MVSVATEHKAVLDTAKELERRGFTATYLAPEPNGLIDLDKFRAALRPDTIVVSVINILSAAPGLAFAPTPTYEPVSRK